MIDELWEDFRATEIKPEQRKIAFFIVQIGPVKCSDCVARLLYGDHVCDRCRYNQSE